MGIDSAASQPPKEIDNPELRVPGVPYEAPSASGQMSIMRMALARSSMFFRLMGA